MATTETTVTSDVPVFKHRVLIADNSRIKFKDVISSLEESQVEVEFHNERNAAVASAATFKPDIIVLNLFLNSSSMLPAIRDFRRILPDSKIIVLTTHYSKENIAESVKSGASDFILEPFEPKMLIQRIRYQLQDREFISPDDLRADSTQISAGFQLTYECLKILAEVRNAHRAVFESLKRVAELSKSTRVNVVLGDVETNTGTIIAASDDLKIDNLQVDLEKYPEVREVLLNSSIVYIKDITANPLTKDIKAQVKTIDITSLLVFPVRHRGETLGTLNIRLGKDGLDVSDKHLKTFYMIALSLGSKVAARRLLKKIQAPST